MMKIWRHKINGDGDEILSIGDEVNVNSIRVKVIRILEVNFIMEMIAFEGYEI